MFGEFEFWLGAAYATFPLGLLLYGWNDIGDAATDEANVRKGNWLFGAKPNAVMRRRLPWIIVAVQAPFLVAFVYIAGWKMLGWFAGMLFANLCYNNLGFKRLPIVDLINQVGYLLIFVLASWLCAVEQLNTPAMIFSALFAMQSHLFGQIMDVEEDRLGGRRSTAVTIGVRPSKILLSSIMLVEAWIAFTYFQGFMVESLMICGAAFFFLDAVFGPKKYPLAFVTTFFVIWNMIALVSMHFVWRYGVLMLS